MLPSDPPTPAPSTAAGSTPADPTPAGSTRTGRPSLRDEHKQLTREQILTAARDTFAESGFRSATISGIARRAGVGRATFYMHFSGKAELADEIARSINPVMVRHFRSLADEPLTPARIEGWLAEGVQILRSFGPIPAVVNEAVGYNRELARTLVDSLRQVAVQLSDDLEQAGQWPGDLDSGQLTALLVATTELMLVMFGPEPEAADNTNLADLARLWHRVLSPTMPP